MKNQEILNQMYSSIANHDHEVEEKIYIKVLKKIVSIVSKVMGVTAGTFAFLSIIFEAIILFVNIRERTNIIEIINKSIPIAVVFIVTMIIYSICLEVYKRV